MSQSPELRGNNEYTQVSGFTRAIDLGMKPARIADYEAANMTVPKPGEFSQNNGVVAAVTSSGEIVVWVPKEDATAPRAVSHEQAIQNLKTNGYTEGTFGVPTL